MIDAKEARRLTDIANGNVDVYNLEDVLIKIRRTALTGDNSMYVCTGSEQEHRYLISNLVELGFKVSEPDEYGDFYVNW